MRARPMCIRCWWRADIWLICIVAGLHYCQAVMMLVWPAAMDATPLLVMARVLQAIGAAHIPQTLAAVMMASATLAVVAVVNRGPVAAWMTAPQQIGLGFSAAGGIWAARVGHYLDGTAIPWPHILADQAGMMALFLAHLGAVIIRRIYP